MDIVEHAAIKTATQIDKMRIAGRLASELLDYLTPHIQAGVTTKHIDTLAHAYMRDVQATVPATLNYAPPGHRPFPASLCTSINQVVCHGIPADKVLKSGDIVNVDVTVIKDGFHGDTSRMFLIGKVAPPAQRLCELTYAAMWRGIRQVKPGNTLGDIGHAIEKFAKECGYSIVREFCGHGIGERFHEAPQVTHFGEPGKGVALEAGMIFTIEPMINAGKPGIRLMPDGWTVVTADRSLSAQWEHTVLVTQTGYEILTLSAGTPAPAAV
jgi:methionyl aminopeptidase